MVAPPRSAHILALDGVRGVAVGLVLFVHLVAGSIDGEKFHALRNALQLTSHGVDLFFVLSGFLIGGILLDNLHSPRALRVFYLRRFLRIVPLYALLLVVTLGLLLKLPEYAAPWWVYATFNSNIRNALDGGTHWLPLAVTWSLAVEEQFYLLAPCVIHFSSRRTLPRILLGVIAGAYAVRWALFLSGSVYAPGMIHFLLPARADNLATGMLLAWAVRAPEARPALDWITRHWRLLAWTLGPLVAAYMGFNTDAGGAYGVVLGYSVINLACGLVVFAAATGQPAGLAKVLELRPLVSLGRYAYFLYLWHAVVMFLLFHVVLRRSDFLVHSVADVPFAAVILLVTWGLAALSWRFFEGPLVRFGQRYKY